MSKKKDGAKNTSTGRDKYTNTIQTETYRQQMRVKYKIPFKKLFIYRKFWLLKNYCFLD